MKDKDRDARSRAKNRAKGEEGSGGSGEGGEGGR